MVKRPNGEDRVYEPRREPQIVGLWRIVKPDVCVELGVMGIVLEVLVPTFSFWLSVLTVVP